MVGSHYVILDATSGYVVLTTYPSNHSQIATVTLKNPLEIFGGFTYGSDGNYYAVYGKNNTSENDNQEVYRVVKYDSQFNEVKSFSVNGADSSTVNPFSSGSADLMEVNGTLVVHASRKRYTSSDGSNHQSQFTMILDSTSMTLKNKFSQYQSNHVSHSFNQFVGFDGDKVLLVDHGDAYPRSVVLHSTSNGGSSFTEKDLLAIPGTVGANCTGLTVGGFVVGNSHYFTAINIKGLLRRHQWQWRYYHSKNILF